MWTGILPGKAGCGSPDRGRARHQVVAVAAAPEDQQGTARAAAGLAPFDQHDGIVDPIAIEIGQRLTELGAPRAALGGDGLGKIARADR